MRPRHRLEHVGRVFCAVAWACATACSSSSGGSNGPSDATIDAATDSGSGDTRDPSKNCVPPGALGNEQGVGAYCEPADAGVPCDKETTARICTADVPGVPDDAWFCTRPCSKDSDCGSNAFCISNPEFGTGCVPAACLPADAGVDASPG